MLNKKYFLFSIVFLVLIIGVNAGFDSYNRCLVNTDCQFILEYYDDSDIRGTGANCFWNVNYPNGSVYLLNANYSVNGSANNYYYVVNSGVLGNFEANTTCVLAGNANVTAFMDFVVAEASTTPSSGGGVFYTAGLEKGNITSVTQEVSVTCSFWCKFRNWLVKWWHIIFGY